MTTKSRAVIRAPFPHPLRVVAAFPPEAANDNGDFDPYNAA